MLAALSAPLAFSAGAAAPAAVTRAAAPSMMAKSKALPFLEQPAHLDGTYAGDAGFDPIGIGSAYNLKWMREAELKHGRICMLATSGYVAVDLGLRAPGAAGLPGSFLAHDAAVKTGHMLLLLGVIGVFESLSYVAISEMLSGETDRQPGDYGFDPLNYKGQKDYSEVEITHCRAAMLAFSGMITQSALFETGFPYVPH